MKMSNESKVGIFAAFAIAILILGYNYLKGRNLFTKTRTYHAVFAGVDGLVTSNPVMINGYRIGQVTEVEMMPENNLSLMVTIEVDSKIEVPVDSEIKIYSSDLLGSKAIQLVLGQEKAIALNNDTLTAKVEPGILENVNKITQPLRAKVENILISLDSTLGGQSGRDLRASIHNLRNSLANLDETTSSLNTMLDKRLNNILANVESITSNLEQNNDKIDNILTNLSSLSDSLQAAHIKQTVENANRMLAEVSETFDNINNGKGSLGQLAQNEEFYKNLEKTAADLDALIKDIKEHPKRYINISVFGGKSKK